MKPIVDLEQYKKEGDFYLSSGEYSEYYYDLKEAMGDPTVLQKIFAQLVVEIPLETEVFVGIEYGGIPLAIICSVMTGKPYAVLRKAKKTHGTRKRIEGSRKKGNAVLLDDVKTTGTSIQKARDYLESEGYNIIKVLTIMERKD